MFIVFLVLGLTSVASVTSVDFDGLADNTRVPFPKIPYEKFSLIQSKFKISYSFGETKQEIVHYTNEANNRNLTRYTKVTTNVTPGSNSPVETEHLFSNKTANGGKSFYWLELNNKISCREYANALHAPNPLNLLGADWFVNYIDHLYNFSVFINESNELLYIWQFDSSNDSTQIVCKKINGELQIHSYLNKNKAMNIIERGYDFEWTFINKFSDDLFSVPPECSN